MYYCGKKNSVECVLIIRFFEMLNVDWGGGEAGYSPPIEGGSIASVCVCLTGENAVL